MFIQRILVNEAARTLNSNEKERKTVTTHLVIFVLFTY